MEKTTQRGTSPYVPLVTYYLSGKIKKNYFGDGYGMYGGELRCIQSFSGKPEGKRPL